MLTIGVTRLSPVMRSRNEDEYQPYTPRCCAAGCPHDWIGSRHQLANGIASPRLTLLLLSVDWGFLLLLGISMATNPPMTFRVSHAVGSNSEILLCCETAHSTDNQRRHPHLGLLRLFRREE